MDPITAIAFASAMAFVPPAPRPNTGSIIRHSGTEYCLDRRTTSDRQQESADLNAPVFTELLGYKSFVDGWDGDGSLAPSASDIHDAIAFVEMLAPYLPLPGAMLSPEGQIGLYWNTPIAYVDINFDSNGTISIYTRGRGAQPSAEQYVDNLNPRDVATLLPILDVLKPMKIAA